MKVPTYKVQSFQTPKTGQTMLNVQANVNAATQAIAAQGELFKTASNISLDFLRAETKMQRATELADLENKFVSQMQGHSLKALDNKNPTAMLASWDASSKRTINDLSRGISDPVVKKRFLASAANTVTSSRGNIMKLARSNRIDQSKAVHLEKIRVLKKQITHGNPLEKMQAMRELFGTPGDPNPDFGSPAMPSIFQKMENLGLISAAGRVALEAETRVGVESSDIYQDLSAAAISGNPAHADEIVNNLASPDRYPNITGSARNSLLNKALNLRDSLTSDQLTKKKNALALAKAQRTETQRETNIDFLSKLSKELDNPNTFEGEPVTLEQLTTALEKNDLSAKDFNALKAIRMADAPTKSNPDLMFMLNNQIDNATSDADLEVIREDIPNYITNKQLSTTDALSIISEIQEQKAKTPRALAIKSERKNLMRVLGVNIDGIIVDSAATIGQKEAINDALQTYDDLVKKHNVNPREAYSYLTSNFRNQQKFNDIFKEAGILSPNSLIFDDIMGLPQGPIDPLVVRRLVEKINNSGLAPRFQFEEMKTLQQIQKIKSEQSINPDGDGGDVFGNGSSGASNPSWWSRLWGGGSE